MDSSSSTNASRTSGHVRAVRQTDPHPTVARVYRHPLSTRWSPRSHHHVLRTDSLPNEREVDEESDFRRELIVHQTSFEANEDVTHIQDLFRALVDDDARTMAICGDIATAAARGRNCLVLTQWTEHLSSVVSMLSARGMSPSSFKAEWERLAPRSWPIWTMRPSAAGSCLSRPAASSARGSIVRRSILRSWRSPSPFEEGLSSTLAESCGRWTVNHPSRSTITLTPRVRYSRACIERDFQGTLLSVSTLVRVARVGAASRHK